MITNSVWYPGIHDKSSSTRASRVSYYLKSTNQQSMSNQPPIEINSDSEDEVEELPDHLVGSGEYQIVGIR